MITEQEMAEQVKLAQQIVAEIMQEEQEAKAKRLQEQEDGPFYSDFDEEYQLWCVFHCDKSFAYGTHGSKEGAESHAAEMNASRAYAKSFLK